MAKQRIDLVLVERGLVESRSLAQRMVMAGQVRVNGQVVVKSSEKVVPDVEITIDSGPPFVSRGGEKLAGAFEKFRLDVTDKICVDVGASTGGFTDCMLQNGAAKVYAIDVGQGILHWKIRQDERVVVMEKTNARHVETLPEPISFVTIDASFISLKVFLPVIKNWYGDTGEMVALVKPQFEAGRAEATKGKGVIRDRGVHRRVLKEVLSFAGEQGYTLLGLEVSPVKGPKGNIEFLAWLGWGLDKAGSDLKGSIARVLG